MSFYPPLSVISDEHVNTKQAAHYLGRENATLHYWHSSGKGPIMPRRVAGRLMWSVAEIKKLLAGETA